LETRFVELFSSLQLALEELDLEDLLVQSSAQKELAPFEQNLSELDRLPLNFEQLNQPDQLKVRHRDDAA
jgi:hypothetical protein